MINTKYTHLSDLLKVPFRCGSPPWRSLLWIGSLKIAEHPGRLDAQQHISIDKGTNQLMPVNGVLVARLTLHSSHTKVNDVSVTPRRQ